MSDGVVNKFKYNKFRFEFNGEPKCNLCGCGLKFGILTDTYTVDSCLNKQCATHSNQDVTTIRQLAFLPLTVFLTKNKRVNINYKTNKEYWLVKGFSYETTLNKVEETKNKLENIPLNTISYYKVMTDLTDEGIKALLSNQTCYSTEHWLNKGYTEEEAKQKVSEVQTNNANKFSRKRKDNPEQYSATTTTQLGYWIKKGYTEEEARQKLKERQTTFSKELCIEKYGEEEGLKVFTERQEKWNKSLTNGGNLKVGYSKISQELFYGLLKHYNIEDKGGIYFATHNKEFRLTRPEGGVWLYDFTDIKRKKIIEYNGDQYHGNPKKYLAEDYPHPFRKDITAKEMWTKDKLKMKRAEEDGYEILYVWDSEYRWGNKQKVIKECIDFLNKKW